MRNSFVRLGNLELRANTVNTDNNIAQYDFSGQFHKLKAKEAYPLSLILYNLEWQGSIFKTCLLRNFYKRSLGLENEYYISIQVFSASGVTSDSSKYGNNIGLDKFDLYLEVAVDTPVYQDNILQTKDILKQYKLS